MRRVRRRVWIGVVAVGSALALGAPAAAVEFSEPRQLFDVNPNTRSSDIDDLVLMGAEAYFIAESTDSGFELWATDGTGEGTRLVVDIFPGLENGFDYSERDLIAIGDTLYFSADDGNHGRELWRSDGTAAGTRMVRDSYPGAETSSPDDLVAAGGVLFFTATTEQAGRELWISDGTEAGTLLVEDIFPGGVGSDPGQLTPVGNAVYFTAREPAKPPFLWVSDGTAAGTSLVDEVDPTRMTAFGEQLILVIDGELWTTDPLTGTALLLDINPSGDSDPQNFYQFGDTLYFSASHDPQGRELWRTDGTGGGTFLVGDLVPGPDDSNPSCLHQLDGALRFWADGTHWEFDELSSPVRITGEVSHQRAPISAPLQGCSGDFDGAALDGLVYFQGTADGSNADFEVWTSGGRTNLFANLNNRPPPFNASSSPGSFLGLGDRILFVAEDANRSREIWRTDGTFAGTYIVMDINTGTESADPQHLTLVGDQLFFVANDGRTGNELWVSDGPDEGATLVKDINPGFLEHSDPEWLVDFNGTLFFSAYDEDNGRELWKSDGTESGTEVVINLDEASADSNPSWLTAVGDWLYFSADVAGLGAELWRTDGTAAGTELVRDIQPGVSGPSSDPEELTAHNGLLFFTADDGVVGREPYVSDGTTEGTLIIDDLRPGELGSAGIFKYFGDTFHYSTRTVGTFIVDGRPGYAEIQEDLEGFDAVDYNGIPVWVDFQSSPNPDESFSNLVAYVDGQVQLIRADEGDGFTASGGIRMAAADNFVFFIARDDVHGEELWRSDGTPEGTVLVSDIAPGTAPSLGQFLVGVRDWVFFQADPLKGDRVFGGWELWISDGTEAETLEFDINPGSGGSVPSQFTVAEDAVYFIATGIGGTEVWVMDIFEGTADTLGGIEPGGRWNLLGNASAERSFFYGDPGDVPLFGDWNGDGIDTPGMFRPSNGFVYLTNTLPSDGGVGTGAPDLTFFFGMEGDQVVVGDWDGDGADSLGIRRGGKMFLTNVNATTFAEHEFWFGVDGDLAVGGDPDGDGRDNIFLYRASSGFVYFTQVTPANDQVAPTADTLFFGVPSDRFLVGDWDGDGSDSVGVFRPTDATYYLANSLSDPSKDGDPVTADLTIPAGASGWLPVAGSWR